MRRLLVRRFESSMFAFQKTLDSLINQSNIIKDWYNKIGKIPIFKKGNLPNIDSLLESIDEDIEGELKDAILENELKEYKEKGLWLIEKKEVKKSFIEHVEKDIEILEGIKNKWFSEGSS